MEIRVSTFGPACVLSPDGPLDTRSAHDFERKAIGAFDAGPHHIVVDFAKVELVTSAALRVLVMLGKKLGKASRTLVLCGLNDMVRTVLDVSGLAQAFVIAPTLQDALARLEAVSAKPAAGAGATPLGSHVVKLLSMFDMLEVGSAAPAPDAPALDPLAKAVLAILSRHPLPSAR
jgi:anti-anti-sigma factor